MINFCYLTLKALKIYCCMLQVPGFRCENDFSNWTQKATGVYNGSIFNLDLITCNNLFIFSDIHINL